MFLNVTNRVLQRKQGKSIVFFLSKPAFTKKAVDSRHSPRRGKKLQSFRLSVLKVCSLHFRPEDLRKSLSGRVYVADGAIPSKFAWSILSPRKRKAPTLRQPLVQTKKNLKREKLDAPATEDPISSVANNSELNITDKELETASFVSEEKESETKLYIKTLEESLAKLRQEIATPRAENSHLREELTSKGGHVKSIFRETIPTRTIQV